MFHDYPGNFRTAEKDGNFWNDYNSFLIQTFDLVPITCLTSWSAAKGNKGKKEKRLTSFSRK
jgi:hypothetical protein